MWKISRNSIAFFLIPLLMACATPQQQSVSPQQQPETVESQLMELQFQVGDPVERIYDFRVDGWKFLDKKNLLMHGGDSQSYLVTLKPSCNGLSLPTSLLVPLASKQGTLTKNDRFQVRNKENTIDYCRVNLIHDLVPIE